MTDAEIAREDHVSVIYFHGMGSQRRFEETSRLVDRLDSYLDAAFKRGGKRLGVLRRIRARAEINVDEGNPDISYIRAVHLKEFNNWDGPKSHISFYEAYWADQMCEERSVPAVIKWILRQVWRPITLLWTPWGERQRLRRAVLFHMLEQHKSWPEGTLENDFKSLLYLYGKFDHPDWTKRARNEEAVNGRNGIDFKDFLHFIKYRNPRKPVRVRRLQTLAREWRRQYVRSEVQNFALMTSLLLAIVVIVGLTAAGVFALLARLPLLFDMLGLAQGQTIPEWAQATPTNALAIGFGVLLAIGLRSFLVNRLADVEAWSTYAETDEKFAKREAVLKKSQELLSHVIRQPDCDRVVVVAHSLGSSVAYDTLLAAVHANRATNPKNPMTGRVDFTKISHFVTLASPIDKIAYFFESFRSPIRRYRKIYNEIRGDIGTAPFTKSGGQPQIHWVNIWDEADIISGPLQSPAASRWTDARIDNVHVNSLSYFNPGAAHNAYFDNYSVIGMLFGIILENRGNYVSGNVPTRHMPDGKQRGLNYRAIDFGPGNHRGRWSTTWRFLALAPWAWLVSLVTWQTGPEGLSSASIWLAVALTALPVFAVLRRFGGKSVLVDPLDE